DGQAVVQSETAGNDARVRVDFPGFPEVDIVGLNDHLADAPSLRRVGQSLVRSTPELVRLAKLVQKPQLLTRKRKQVSGKLECDHQVGIANFQAQQPAGKHVFQNGLCRIPFKRDADAGDVMSVLLQFLGQALRQVLRAAVDKGRL